MAKTSVRKRCPRCRKTKPALAYHSRNHGDGLDAYCKPCRKAISKQYWSSNHDRLLGLSRQYSKSVAGKNTHAAYRRSEKGRATQLRARNKSRAAGKYAARYAVTRAIIKGLLPKAKTRRCSLCGKKAAEWHHHKGYGKPNHLDVIPLCVPCHKKADQKPAQSEQWQLSPIPSPPSPSLPPCS
jgi:hypothetical protein